MAVVSETQGDGFEVGGDGAEVGDDLVAEEVALELQGVVGRVVEKGELVGVAVGFDLRAGGVIERLAGTVKGTEATEASALSETEVDRFDEVSRVVGCQDVLAVVCLRSGLGSGVASGPPAGFAVAGGGGSGAVRHGGKAPLSR